MTDIILILPVIFSIILFLMKSRTLNNLLVILYSVIFLLAAIFLYFNPNSSGSVFNNYFKVDSLNILFLLILAVVFAGVALYNHSFVKSLNLVVSQHKKYSIGIILFIFSMTGAILSNHLGLSWVFIEATTLASAYLIYLPNTKQSLEAVWKYVFICSIGISLAFVGIILLLIASEQVNSLFFDELYINAGKIIPFWLKLSFIFILTGFGTKVGLAPVHSWLPDAHSEAPSPVSALLSATLLNSAFLVLLRYYKLMDLSGLSGFANTLLTIMGIMSISITAIFVFNSNNYKRMLAYSSIENMGIAAIGITLGPVGIYAAMLQLFAHSLIKSSFFLTAGNILTLFETKKINKISGLLKKDRLTGWLWIACFVGISGLPPSPLFLSKFLLLKELFSNNQIVFASVFLLLLLIILFGIGRSVITMTFSEAEEANRQTESGYLYKFMYIPQAVFLTGAAIVGIYTPSFIYNLLNNAVIGCQ
ncbi:MAG TPA: proton-conducting transporter membrane subunit [Candidatus Gastranaerophilales bacterium]|nr:proton-conducting transporter membrane subunit [Candidatus Gastranaerophilales bacterium]